jgi:hypothetical protein
VQVFRTIRARLFRANESAARNEHRFWLLSTPAGPANLLVCKPLPGLIIAFRYQLALDQCLLIGRSAADRTLAVRTGMRYSAV